MINFCSCSEMHNGWVNVVEISFRCYLSLFDERQSHLTDEAIIERYVEDLSWDISNFYFQHHILTCRNTNIGMPILQELLSKFGITCKTLVTGNAIPDEDIELSV